MMGVEGIMEKEFYPSVFSDDIRCKSSHITNNVPLFLTDASKFRNAKLLSMLNKNKVP